MLTSDKTDKILPALAKALANIGAVKKDSDNPFFKSKYADINSIYETVREPLLSEGILILQPIVSKHSPVSGEFKDYVVTQLVHSESGQYVSSEFPIISKDSNDPQKIGAASTYARRFGLQSLIGLATEDDDGNTASGKDYSAYKSSVKKPAKKEVKEGGSVQKFRRKVAKKDETKKHAI